MNITCFLANKSFNFSLFSSNNDKMYYLYAIFALIFFSFFSQRIPLLIMSQSGAGLITIRDIYMLKDKIQPPFKKMPKILKAADKAEVKEVIEQ